MTTITIKNGKKLPKTNFESLEELLDWAVDYFQNEPPSLLKLSKKLKMPKKK